MSTDLHTMERLISLRRHALEDLRRDMQILEGLVADCQRELEREQTEYQQLEDEIRTTESVSLSPLQMMSMRRYLAHKQQCVEDANCLLGDASKQLSPAREAFDACCVEVRTLERVLDRRSNVVQQMEQRKNYLIADDQEVLRQERGRENHGLY